jgi:hypothetical protein
MDPEALRQLMQGIQAQPPRMNEGMGQLMQGAQTGAGMGVAPPQQAFPGVGSSQTLINPSQATPKVYQPPMTPTMLMPGVPAIESTKTQVGPMSPSDPNSPFMGWAMRNLGPFSNRGGFQGY